MVQIGTLKRLQIATTCWTCSTLVASSAADGVWSASGTGIIVFTYGASCSALTSTASSPSARRNAAIAAVKVFSLTPFGSATYELATAPPLLQVHDERGEALGRGRPLAGACRMHEGALDGRSRLRGASERGERDRPAHALDPVAGALRALVARAGRHGGRRRGLAEERLGDREADARRAECGRERGPCAPRPRRGDPDVAHGH